MVEDATLPGLLGRAATATPDRVAVVVDGGGQLTYGEWDRRSDAVARGLASLGLRAGDRVVLRFDSARWADYAVAYVGALRAGGVAVPTRAALSPHELRRVADDSAPAVVVAPPDLAPAEAVTVADPADLEQRGGPRPPPVGSGPAEVLYRVRPLSPPAALVRSHGDVLAGTAAASAQLAGASGWVHAFPVGTAAAQDALHACLGLGVPTTVLPDFDPDRLSALLAAAPAPAVGIHPALADSLLAAASAGRHDLSGVRTVVVSGGRPPPALLVRLATAFPHAGVLVGDPLGHTRQAPGRDASAGVPPWFRAWFAHDRDHPGGVGRPLGAAGVWVTDADDRRLAAGEVGDVWLGTDAAGVPTGDVGYLDADGVLYLTGRRGAVRGRRATVSRGEVEAVLETAPAVVEAVVTGPPPDSQGGGFDAVVVASSPVPEERLRNLVRDRLGEDKTPQRVVFAPNSAGVVGRVVSPAAPEVGGEEPASPTEETVAAVWRRVLGGAGFGRDDDFFAVGGDWLGAAAVVALVEDATAVRVPADAFAAAPTLAGLAATVDRLADQPPPPAPIAHAQEGMLWHEQFAPGCQNLPGLARRYRGDLDVEALRRALDAIVARHEALRTTFAVRDGRPAQVVGEHRDLHLPVRDLSDVPPPDREAEVGRVVAAAGRRPFDLVAGPLFEPALLRLAEDDHVLVIRTHHSVFDDWSVGIFRRELGALYPAFVAGRGSPLPEPQVSFPEAARRQRRRLAGAGGSRELSFWRRELRGAPFTTQLPVDDPDLPEGSTQPSGRPVTVTIPPEVHAGLRRAAREWRATVFMATLAAFGVLVRRYTAQDDLLLATVVANRNRTDVEGVIGCFTKKVPLRLPLAGDPTFAEVLARTRTALLGGLAHQDLPFEAVVQDVLGVAAAAHGLVPHVAVMFQGVTPAEDLDLPGVDSWGLETSTRAVRAHFMADDRAAPPPVSAWGGGLYNGSFLIVSVDESDERLSFTARGAFHSGAVGDLLASFRTLLSDVVADPDRPISQFRLVDREAAPAALRDGQPTAGPDAATGRGPATNPTLAPPTPGAADLTVLRSRGEAVTHTELDARVRALAARLRSVGVGPGAKVGLCLGVSVDAVVAALAVWRVGAAWVGLAPDEAEEQLGRLAAEPTMDVVVGEDPLGRLRGRFRVVPARADGSAPATSAPADVGPDADAVVIHGGGWAAPHGVVLDRRAVAALAAGFGRGGDLDPGLQGPRRVCLSAPPSHDGFLRQLATLLAGHTLHVAGGEVGDDPGEIVALVGEGAVDVVDVTPAEFDGLVAGGLSEAVGARRDGEPVVVVGSRGAVTPELWSALRGLRGARAHLLYGPPEAAFAATVRPVTGTSARLHFGRPLAHVAAHVLDEHGREVPTRAVGELYLGGAGIARRLCADADGSSVDGTGDPGGRLLATGQLARRLPDGAVELVGAVGGDADLRGFRVDRTRIEAVLAAHPDVREVAVAVERGDGGQRRLVARLAVGGDAPSVAEVREFLWRRLPGYACPSAVLTRDGRMADHDPPAATTGPARVVENALAAVLAEVLDVDEVPADANYWQLFPFLDALYRVREAGIEVADEHVTRNRTLAALAADVAAHRHRR